jgi:arginase
MSRACTIIGMGCGHGARDRGCADGPQTLRRGGLAERLRLNFPDLRCMELLASAGEPFAVVAGLCDQLAGLVARIVRNHRFPLVIGGDHSCAIGTWSGISRALGGPESFRLIWIDAHMDMHTPQTSPSGALHGMPLACLLGHGDPALACHPPALAPGNVTLMGIRSWESEEADLARRLGVRVVGMADLNLPPALTQAAGSGRFGITIDLDAIDPIDAPGVGTPVAGGIRASALLAALAPLLASPACVGLEIAEYSPPHDIDHRTAALVEAFIMAALQPGEPP